MDKKLDYEGVLLVAELWKRRVEYLWGKVEGFGSEPLDIDKLDAMIEEDERLHAEAVAHGKKVGEEMRAYMALRDKK